MRTFLWSLLALAGLVLPGCSEREERLKTAQQKAEEVAAVQARLAKGVGEALKAEGKGAAESLGQGLGELAKGLGSGLDKSVAQVDVKVGAGLASRLKVTRASRSTDGSLSLYVVTQAPLSTDLTMRVLDGAGQEVGRVSARFEEAAATGRFVDFRFDPRTPLLTAGGFVLE